MGLLSGTGKSTGYIISETEISHGRSYTSQQAGVYVFYNLCWNAKLTYQLLT